MLDTLNSAGMYMVEFTPPVKVFVPDVRTGLVLCQFWKLGLV
jgi:hypothetical protein